MQNFTTTEADKRGTKKSGYLTHHVDETLGNKVQAAQVSQGNRMTLQLIHICHPDTMENGKKNKLLGSAVTRASKRERDNIQSKTGTDLLKGKERKRVQITVLSTVYSLLQPARPQAQLEDYCW